MDLFVTCDCGHKTAVTPAQCGQAVTCYCGKQVAVPRLSDLRKSAGLAAFEVAIHDRLRTMKNRGELPVESHCIACGVETQHAILCQVECEKPVAKGGGYWYTVVMLVLAPTYYWMMSAWRDFKNPEVHGAEIIVDAPLRVCESCAAQSSPGRVIVWMRKTDLYRQLLEKYPQAVVKQVR